MNIAFLGSGAFAIPSLNALAASAHKIVQVISQPDRPAGRGKVLTPTAVAQWALEKNMPLLRTDNANAEALAILRELKPDALAVIAFGQKLSDELLAVAPRGNINLHSSLLPKYRGAAPINWAVINNDPIAGVCVIEVTPKMDAGDIFAQASTPIGTAETAGELHDRLAQLGSPLLPQVLDQLAAGTAMRTPQDPALATRAPKLSREIAWVDFTQPAAIVSARIRGMSPWPGIQIQLSDPPDNRRAPPLTAALLKCQATPSSATHPTEICGTVLRDRSIACATGSLQLLQVQPAGKKPMDAQSFANGYGLQPGAKIHSLIPVPPT